MTSQDDDEQIQPDCLFDCRRARLAHEHSTIALETAAAYEHHEYWNFLKFSWCCGRFRRWDVSCAIETTKNKGRINDDLDLQNTKNRQKLIFRAYSNRMKKIECIRSFYSNFDQYKYIINEN